MKYLLWIVFLCAPVVIMAQPIRLKVPPLESSVYTGTARIHAIVQFQNPPLPATLFTLVQRGAILLDYVPDNAVLVTLDGSVSLADLGVRFSGPLTPQQKISPLIANGSSSVIRGNYLIEFHPDVDPSAARRLILNLPLVLVENPDLLSRHLLVHIPDLTREVEALALLAAQDEVEYIFPASSDLIQGVRVIPYADTASQNIAALGDGWDGPGLNAVTLFYFFSHLTAQLADADTEREILRAIATWTAVAEITWLPGTSATASRTVNLLFAQGDHGDGFPFDGSGGILAHTFAPPPTASEPLAGDVHFDDAEPWRIGSDFDVFSVALHELGHSLGLAHSDNPAAAMYPYYKRVTGLAGDDQSSILEIYAAKGSISPLALTVNAPPPVTTAASIVLSGTVTGGSGGALVLWSSSTGASGMASVTGENWLTLNIPLAIGVNVITLTAADASGNASLAPSVIRQVVASSPLALTLNAPPSTTPNASISLSGTITGGSGGAVVIWSSSAGASGPASVTGLTWTASSIPLALGANLITVTAADATGNAFVTASVIRQIGAPPPLSLTVDAPPSSTTDASISLSGTVTGGSGGAAVKWRLSTGASGAAVVTGTNWLAANIPLAVGLNSIAITAADASGSVSRTVSVTRQAVVTPPPPPGTDTTGPALLITYPSSTSFATTLTSLTFTGTASDRSGVASVTWSTNTGSSGAASGTTQWSAVIPLLVGSNTVIIRSTDTVGNMSWRSVVVTRK